MRKSQKTFLSRSIVVLLLLVVLLTSVGSAAKAYALAQEVIPELEPVYDTEVVTLKDYVDNVLTDAQVAVFNTFLGSYVASQAGLNEYELEYPYTDRTGVIGWLQDAGMKLYNAIITGGSFDLVTGTDLRTYIVTAASYAIGMAQKAHTYTDINDFLDDVDNSTHYFVPIDPILQASINSYFGRDYGLWNWQFDTKPFKSNVSWIRPNAVGTLLTEYNNIVNGYNDLVRLNANASWLTGWQVEFGYFNTHTNIFINTSTHKIYLCDDNGNYSTGIINSPSPRKNIYVNNGTGINYDDSYDIQWYGPGFYPERNSYNPNNYSTYKDIVIDLYNFVLTPYYTSQGYIYFEDFVKHVYCGDNWATKQEIFNIEDLNFSQNDSPSYNQVPDDSYFDLKGFLTDIVNNTNILNVILDNLFKPDGTLNVDPALVKVSITIPDTNPLPVNLNEIEVYTHNEYLDTVKKYSYDFADTIGEYVAFWHNADYEIVYAILGSVIIVMIGAFIGKWGHS